MGSEMCIRDRLGVFGLLVGESGWTEKNQACPLGHSKRGTELMFGRYSSSGDLFVKCVGKHKQMKAFNFRTWLHHFSPDDPRLKDGIKASPTLGTTKQMGEPVGEKVELFYNLYGLRYGMVQFGLKFRWNERSRKVEYSQHDGEWQTPSDRDIDQFRSWMQDNFVTPAAKSVKPWDAPKTKFESLMNAHLAGFEIDPFMVWLKSLDEWDGVSRLDTLITLSLIHI